MLESGNFGVRNNFNIRTGEEENSEGFSEFEAAFKDWEMFKKIRTSIEGSNNIDLKILFNNVLRKGFAYLEKVNEHVRLMNSVAGARGKIGRGYDSIQFADSERTEAHNNFIEYLKLLKDRMKSTGIDFYGLGDIVGDRDRVNKWFTHVVSLADGGENGLLFHVDEGEEAA